MKMQIIHKKPIIILLITLFVLSGVYFLFYENIINLKTNRIRDIVETDIEGKYLSLLEHMASAMKRTIIIEDRKIEYIKKALDINELLKSDKKTSKDSILYNYTISNPLCSRVLVINRNLEILYSTSPRDINGSQLDRIIYQNIFNPYSISETQVVVDPMMESLVFFKKINSSGIGEIGILFYYSRALLDEVFKNIVTFQYSGLLITPGKVVLVNFPEIDLNEEQNLNWLVNTIIERNYGAVRFKMKGLDKTVYFKGLSSPVNDWKLGFAIDTELFRVSKIGILLLSFQIFVIISFIIFVYVNIRSKKRIRKRMEVFFEKDEIGAIPEEAPAEKIQDTGESKKVETFQPVPGKELEDQKVSAITDGILSLKDVEELKELEEIGEAEIAEAIEELEEVEEEHLLHDQTVKESELNYMGVEQKPQVDREKRLYSVNEKQKPFIVEGKEKNEEIVEEKLEESQVFISQEPKTKDFEESVEKDLPEGIEPQSSDYHLPEFDKLVRAKLKKVESTSTQETPPTIPEEIYKKVETSVKDDELAHLIRSIENKDEKIYKEHDKIVQIFESFIEKMGISRGAILVRNEEGRFYPLVIIGLSTETEKKLFFTGEERVFNKFLVQGKIIHIRENIFFNEELRNKFDLIDSGRIKQLFLIPLILDNRVCGIVVICLTISEVIGTNITINNIKSLQLEMSKYI